MKNVNLIYRLAAGWLVASLYGVVMAQNAPNALNFTDVTAEASTLDSKFLRVGANTPLSQILRVKRGVPERQVIQLIGQPIAVSNNNGASTWEYQFSLPLAAGRDSLVCQFMVISNGANRVVDGTYWRRPQCQALAGTTVDFSADVLFGFDQDLLSDLGKANLDSMLSGLPKQSGPLSVNVVGHSDRLGNPTYNQRLSERRARSAADYLVSRGVPARAVSAMGRGATEPVVACEGSQPNAALKSCLAPNRRISIQIRTAAP